MRKFWRYQYNTPEHHNNTAVESRNSNIFLHTGLHSHGASCMSIVSHSPTSHMLCLWTCVSVRVLVCCTCVFSITRSLISRALISCFVPVHFPLPSVHLFLLWWQHEQVTVSPGTLDGLWPSCLSVYFLCLSGSESRSANRNPQSLE